MLAIEQLLRCVLVSNMFPTMLAHCYVTAEAPAPLLVRLATHAQQHLQQHMPAASRAYNCSAYVH